MYLVLVGTKAQLIKMAPVMREMTCIGVPYRFVLSGQHRDTMKDLIEQFELPDPEYLMPLSESDTKIKVLVWWIRALMRCLFSRQLWLGTQYCVVHGDTLSTLLGALCARIRGKKVLHIEAGLRSFNFWHPFPEEITRILVTRLAHYFYVSDAWGASNVRALVHPKPECIVQLSGNTLRDSLWFALSRLKSESNVLTESFRYCVVSVHRFENLQNASRFDAIMEWVVRFAETRRVYFVLHPATRKVLEKTGWDKQLQQNANVRLLPRMGYAPFIGLLSRADFLATDGGSNQEECSYMGLPCLLLRDATERQEGVGETSILSRLDSKVIAKFLERLSMEGEERGQLFEKLTANSPSVQIAKHMLSLINKS